MNHMITEAQEKMDKKQEGRRVTRGKREQNLLIPLSSVDNCNSIRIGSKKKMDEGSAEEWGVEWDKSKE